ncbi:hypothetical protein NLJ89_g2948 [Agrocybe chaxingu]|uniref:DUF6535 domain-containing protein n=1 Tax=Agrocybe chaxingu TaxID=84603 RepID=A0A9W8K5N2_9AGAR|nr:hypothetical protein NLJ89_g2948 [Agrocybe chaxingu]
MVQDYDEARCMRWKDEVQNLLIFAGLFSAVVTSFAVETQRLLQEDPDTTAALLLVQIATQLNQNVSSTPIPTTLAPFSVTSQAIRVNIFIFISLVLSLTTVLFGILALQWLREFQRKENLSHTESLVIRHLRFEGLIEWKVPQIVYLLPVLLQSALVLFFIGLIDFLTSIHAGLAIAVSVVAGITLILLGLGTVLPALQTFFYLIVLNEKPGVPCPYKSPQAWVVFRLLFEVASFIFKRAYRVHWAFVVASSRIETVAQARGWSDYDELWKLHKNVDIDSPLTWAASTFTQNFESVCAIYHCFRDIDIRKAWRAYWRLMGQEVVMSGTEPDQKGSEILRDLVSEALIQHFSNETEMRHSHPFILHHLELYNRIMTSMSRLPDDHEGFSWYSQSHTPTCPNISWTEFGFSSSPDLPREMQLQSLNSLLVKMEKKTLEANDMRLFWNLVFRFLENDSRYDIAPGSVIDDAFTRLGQWMEGHDTTHPQTRMLGMMGMNAFIDQMVLPLYVSASIGPRLQRNLVDLGLLPSFLHCISIMMNEPHFMEHFTDLQAWQRFVEVCNLDSRYAYVHYALAPVQ